MAGRVLDHVSVWDGLPGVGGASRLHFLGEAHMRRRREVSAAEQWTVEIGPDSDAWGELTEERVLQAVWIDPDDGTELEVREARIRRPAKTLESGGERRQSVEADGVLLDLLHNSTLIEKVEANGDIRRRFVIEQILPSVHLADIILPEAPSYITLGTVEPDEPVTMVYDNDHPLTAAQELAKIATFVDGTKGAELELRRVAAGDYRLDLVQRIGPAETKLWVEDAKNLLSGTEEKDSGKIGTRIYPIGGENLGEEASMADAEWMVASQSGATLTMQQEILGEDDQLNGLTLQDEDGDTYTISDTTAPRTVVLSASPGKTLAGTLVRFKRPVTGPSGTTQGKLSYLESPAAIAKWGITKSVRLERPDIPNIDNLVPNPALRQWAGSSPVDYVAIGGAAVSRNTDLLYWRSGEASARVVCSQEGQGIETRPFRVTPTERSPFFVAQARLWPVLGHVRMEIVDVTNGRKFPAEQQGEAVTVATGRWIESFGVSPGGTPTDNFFTNQTRQFKIRWIARGGPAEFYFDMAQMTQTPQFVEFFYEGRASRDLWMLAKRGLDEIDESAEAYEVDFVDLARVGKHGAAAAGEAVLGADANVKEETLGVDFTSRILVVDSNERVEGDTRVTLAEKTNDLTALLGEPSRRQRVPVQTEQGRDIPLGDCTNLLPEGTNYGELCSGAGSGREVIAEDPEFLIADAGLQAGDEIAVGWDGKLTFTDPGGTPLPDGEEPDPGGESSSTHSLKRTSVGQHWKNLATGSSLPSDLIVCDGSATPTAEGIQTGADPAAFYLDPASQAWLPATQLVVQQTFRLNSGRGKAEVWSRFTCGGGHPNWEGYECEADGDTGEHQIKRWLGGSASTLDTDPNNPTIFAWRSQKVFSRDLSGDAHVDVWTEDIIDATSEFGVIHQSIVDASPLPSGSAGWGSENAFSEGVMHRDLFVCTSNVVTVSNVPMGWKVKLASQDMADATEQTGLGVLHDCGGLMFGRGGATLELYDDNDVLQDSISPPGGIIGGDVYTVDQAAVQAEDQVSNGTAVSSTADGLTQHDVSVTTVAGQDYLVAFVHYTVPDPAHVSAVTLDPGGANEAEFEKVGERYLSGSDAELLLQCWVLHNGLAGVTVPGAGTYTVRATVDNSGPFTEGVLSVVPVEEAKAVNPSWVAGDDADYDNQAARTAIVEWNGSLVLDALGVIGNSIDPTPDSSQSELVDVGSANWVRAYVGAEVENAGKPFQKVTWSGAFIGTYMVVVLTPKYVGDQTPESSFDVSASYELRFVDSEGNEIANTEAESEGVRTEEYSRGCTPTTIPEGTFSIVPYRLRKGDGGPAIACVRNPMLNRGTACCEFREEVGAEVWRLPEDTDLVAHYSCDEEHAIIDDENISSQSDWLTNQSKIDSRTIYDRGPQAQHGILWGEDATGFTPETGMVDRGVGASYLGLTHPYSPTSTFPSHGGLVVEPSLSPNTLAPDDIDLWYPVSDVTHTMWIAPWVTDSFGPVMYTVVGFQWLFGRYNGFVDPVDCSPLTSAGVDIEQGGFQFAIDDYFDGDVPHFYFGYVSLNDTHQPGTCVEQQEYELVWEFNWMGPERETIFNDANVTGPVLTHPIFVAVRLSPYFGPSGAETQDVDVFIGSSLTGELRKLSPEMHPSRADHPSAHGIPAIKRAESPGLRPSYAYQGQFPDARQDGISGYESGGSNFTGMMDEMRRYNRALTDAEIRGLFHDPSATQGLPRDPSEIQALPGFPSTVWADPLFS